MERLLKKLSYSFLTMFLAVTTLFFIIRLAPGDPIEKILGPEVSQEQVDKYREQLGLDQPISQQFIDYLQGVPKGDLGNSLFKKRTVLELLVERLPPTILLASVSIVLATFIGVMVGILAGYYKSKGADKIIRVASLLLLSFPIFSLAPMLVLIFSIKLGFFPVSEWGELKHIFLPTLTLVVPLSSIITRITRNKYLEEKSAPWVRVLESKGLSPIPIALRVAKVCMPTILNVVAIQLSVVLAGTMITETIFDIPGVGSLLFEGIQNRDYPVVQGVVIYSTIVYMGVYFLIDYANELIDPRIVHD